MQTPLINHYLAEFLDTFLNELAQKFPMSPLSAIVTNYLYMSDDGTEISRLKVFAANLYNIIKQLEELEDEKAYAPEPPLTSTEELPSFSFTTS